MLKTKHLVLISIVCLLLGLTIMSEAIVYRPLTVKDMSKKADAILVGKCEGKECEFVAGHFETRVKIKVEEYLKGDLGSEVTLTIPGGQVEEPIPLGQYVSGTPQFVKGEEVLLFLSTKETQLMKKRLEEYKSNANMPEAWKQSIDRSTLGSSPVVVGSWQGKYTVLTDAQTGEQRVTRFRLESLGYVHSDKVADKLYSMIVQTSDESPEKAREIQEKVDNILAPQEVPQTEEESAAAQGLLPPARLEVKSSYSNLPDEKAKEKALKTEKKIRELHKPMTFEDLKKIKADKEGGMAKHTITDERDVVRSKNFSTALPSFNKLQRLSEFKEEIGKALQPSK